MANNDEKKERFKRLASLRTNKVIKSLKVLGNCANKGAYEYSDAEIARIFSAIDDQLRNTKAKFKGTSRVNVFKL